jgi:predicted MFS family arabinose efflux permease
MTSFHALFSVGMALGAWCGAFFSDLGVGLTYHFVIVVAAALTALGWASQNLIRDKPDASEKSNGPLFQFPNQALISIGIITFCCMLGEGAMSDWSVNYMEKIVHAGKALAPIGLSAFATAMTTGRIFGDRARTVLGDKRVIVLGGVLATVGLSLALVLPMPFTTIAGFFMVGLGLSAIVPISYSIAGNSQDLSPGVGLAMVTTVGYSGFLFGPPIIGFISRAQNLQIALVVVAALFASMTFLGLRYRQRV